MNDMGEPTAPTNALPLFTQMNDELNKVLGSPASGGEAAPVTPDQPVVQNEQPVAPIEEGAPVVAEVPAVAEAPVVPEAPKPVQAFRREQADFTFKGVGSTDKLPSASTIENVRRYRHIPSVVEAFNDEYGAGSADRVLSLPSKEIMENLFTHRANKDVVKEFDSLFGGISKQVIQIEDPATDPKKREELQKEVLGVLTQGKTGTVNPDSFKLDPQFVAASKFLYQRSMQEVNARLESLKASATDENLSPYERSVAQKAVKNIERRQLGSSDADFADWGLSMMGFVHNNLPKLGIEAINTLSRTPEEKAAFLYLFQAADPSHVEYSMGGTARAVAGMALDPATYFGIGTLGLGTLFKEATKTVTKEGVIALLKKGAETGIQAGVNTALYAGSQDALKQSVELQTGAIDKYSFSRTGIAAAEGAATGFALGTGLGTATAKLAQWIKGKGATTLADDLKKPASEAPSPPEAPSTAAPAVAEAVPEAPAPAAPPPIQPREVSPKLFAQVDALDAQIAAHTERVAAIEDEVNKLGGAENRAAPIVDDQIAQIEKQLEGFKGKKANSAPARRLQQQLEDLKNTPEYQRANQINTLLAEQESTRLALVETQAERAALGPKVGRVTTEAERLTAARDRAANAPTFEEANKMTPEERVQHTIEGTTPTNREWQRATEAPKASHTEVPEDVISILDRVADLSNMNWEQIRNAISPVVDKWLGTASKSADNLFSLFESAQPALDLTKLQALMTKSVSVIEKAIEDAKLNYDALVKLKVTDAKQIEAAKALLADLTAQYGQLQKIDIPLGRYSGRLLAVRQIEDRINALNRVDVEALKAKGVSPDQIAKAVVEARRKLNLQRVDRLTQKQEDLLKNLEKAPNAEKKAEIEAKLNENGAALDKELDALAKKGAKEANTLIESAAAMAGQVSKDVIGIGINFMLSGLGTLKRNIVGGIAQNALMKANLFAGKVLHPIAEGIRSGKIGDIPMNVAEGLKVYRIMRDGRYYGLRSGANSLAQVWVDAVSQGAKSAWNRTTTQGARAEEGVLQGIRGENYGAKGNVKAVIDTIGGALDFPTIGMRLTDETVANIFNKSGAGEYAALRFYERLRGAADEVTAKLRDPTLDAATRAKYEADLKALKGKNPSLDFEGTTHDLKSFVDKAVADSYDKNGNFINQQAIERTNYLLLRDDLQGVWKGVEKIVNDHPSMKILIPFLRSPIQGAKRGFEQIPIFQLPGLRNLGLVTDFASELKSSDPIIAARARGKYYTGVVMVATLWEMAESGLLPAPSQWWDKQEMDARRSTSKPQGGYIPLPVNIPYMGNTIDTTGLDPLSVPIQFVSFIYHGMKDYDRRLLAVNEVNQAGEDNGYSFGKAMPDDMYNRAGEFLKLAAAATAVSFMSNPSFGFAQDFTALINAWTKSSDPNDILKDSTQSSKVLSHMLHSQIGKYSPALYKGVRDMNDNKLYDTSVMDTHTIWSTVSDIVKAEFSWYRDDISLRYDATGHQIDRKYTPRSIAGPLTTQQPTTTEDRVLAVNNALYELAKDNLDRHYVTFSERVPDKFLAEIGVDPRTIQAVTSDRKVLDVFAKNLRETGVTDVLYDALVGEGAKGMPPREKVDKVRRTLTMARQQAWVKTLRQEGLSNDGDSVSPDGNQSLFLKRKEGEYWKRRDYKAFPFN